MYIEPGTIITISGVLGALATIGAAAYKVIKWFQAQENGKFFEKYYNVK